METNLKTPIVLEFYGLPGSGKSTISHRLADEIRSIGLRVWEPSYEIDRKYGNMIRKVVKFAKLVNLAIFNHRMYMGVRCLVKANGYQGILAWYQLANIAHKIVSYKITDRFDVTIWDEGLVQASVSLAVNGNRSASDNQISLMSYTDGSEYMKVYVKVDKGTALRRMKGRSSNDSRVEKMANVEEKMSLLSRIEIACDSIAKDSKNTVSKSLEIDTVGMSLDEIDKKLLESWL